MSTNISGFGYRARIVASNTFPTGFEVTQFPDDTDPFDLPEITIADSGMGLNGDLITWSTPVPIEFSLSVIPDSEDDQNLSILLEANRIGRNKISAQDLINIVGFYPDGRTVNLTDGIIVSGPPSTGVASGGRKKTKTYGFRFENKS